MEQIIGLSFDCLSSPIISLKSAGKPQIYQLGVASYSADESQAIIAQNPIKDDLLPSTLFLLALNHYIKEETFKNAQPFSYPFSGRDWAISFVGKINEENKHHLFSKEPYYIPKGDADAELILCWLLEQFRIKPFSWNYLFELLQQLNQYGEINLLLSDGQNIIAYHDENDGDWLNWSRYCPPHQEGVQFVNDQIIISLDAMDLNHTFILFSNKAILNGTASALRPGQMLIARRGEIVWDSVQNYTSLPLLPEAPPSNEISPILEESYIIPVPLRAEESSKIYIPNGKLDSSINIFSVKHESRYHYESPVHLSKHLYRLQPQHDLFQSILNYKLTLLADDKPVDAKACNFVGAFGNHATICEISEPYTDLYICSEFVICLSGPPTQRNDLLHQRRTIPLVWMPWDRIMMQAYLVPQELPESELFELSEYAMSFVKRNNNDVIETLNDINQTIYTDYAYVSGSTTLSTTPYDVYVNRRGVCQDFANLFICLARLLNIPARYRVGYIYTGADYTNKIQSEASHAWIEVYLPLAGWIGFDPTNGCSPDLNHIRVACGRNYRDATPTSGTIYKGGGREELLTYVQVIALSETDLKNLTRS